MDHDHRAGGNGGFFASRANVVLVAFLAIGAFYLILEHRAHLLGWLPWLVLAACPLLHMYMHGGHEDHGAGGHRSDGAGSDRRGSAGPSR